MAKTALILGATGGIGGEMARALATDGWTLRALSRDPARVKEIVPGMIGIEGDCLNRDDVLRAAESVDLIVHGVHPPGYRNWAGLCMPMLNNTIAAARAYNALIFFPGTVYNFGPDAGAVVHERSPQNPKTRKGKIRVEMEQALARAADDGVRTIILRAGDFFGPRGRSSWLSQGMVRPGARVREITYPGATGVAHAYAYLPDMAKAGAALVARNGEMAAFETFHFEGHHLEDGRDFAEVIADLVGGAKIKPLPWGAIGVIGLFNETMRETYEMRFLWREPLKLDGRKLRAFLGGEPRTPLCQALEHSLRELGCL
jgi:nucleoside-diphosphate-sugar epimerase